MPAARSSADPRVDGVSFTGGPAAAAAIGAAAPLKRLMFELGGNSANIVHDDADLDWTAAALVAGGFSNTGQSCNSVQRVIVQRAVVEPLIERLIRRRPGGSYRRPARRRHRHRDARGRAIRPARRVVAGRGGRGGRDAASRRLAFGALLPPTILGQVRREMRVACEEVFGPVLVVLPYDSLDEAIEIANATPYGLQGAVFTRSLEVAFRAAREVKTGAVFVNRSSNFRLDHLPFGGQKESGTTREGGRYTLDEMTHVKLVMIDASMSGSPHPLARR